jgi:hypothetical protein
MVAAGMEVHSGYADMEAYGGSTGMEARGGGTRAWRHGGSDGGLPAVPCATASLAHGGARQHHHERVGSDDSTTTTVVVKRVDGPRELRHGGIVEWQPDDGGLRSGPRGPISGLRSFLLLLKIDFWCRLT